MQNKSISAYMFLASIRKKKVKRNGNYKLLKKTVLKTVPFFVIQF